MTELMNKKEAAARLRVSERTIDRERDARRLNFVRVGGKVFFTQEIVEEYIRNQTTGRQGEPNRVFNRGNQK